MDHFIELFVIGLIPIWADRVICVLVEKRIIDPKNLLSVRRHGFHYHIVGRRNEKVLWQDIEFDGLGLS